MFTGRASCVYLIARFAEVVTPAPPPPPPPQKKNSDCIFLIKNAGAGGIYLTHLKPSKTVCHLSSAAYLPHIHVHAQIDFVCLQSLLVK